MKMQIVWWKTFQTFFSSFINILCSFDPDDVANDGSSGDW